MILAAMNNKQLAAALDIVSGNPMVAFATLDEQVLAKMENTLDYTESTEVSVYFYEMG